MKSLLLTLISFLFFGFTGNKHKTDLERQNIKGKVKYTIINNYIVKQAKLQIDSLEDIDTNVYNQNGNLTEEDKYYDDSCLEYKALYKHDSLNNIAETDIYNISLKGTPKSSNMVDNFFATPRSRHRKDGPLILTYKIKAQSNRLSLKVENKVYDAKDKFLNRWESKYDRNGQEIERNGYDGEGSFTGRITFNYDDEGNTEEIDKYGLDSIPISKITVKTDKKDKNGNWLQRTRWKNGKPIEIVIRRIEYYP